ncbi:MAG: SRPBCC domain-containing protein [Thermomicrobiales bacterium]|nr:SRPBCC domain-containing protein [Thermomicrobiales bacterium]
MTQSTINSDTTLVIERTFDASPAFLFNAFTDPAILEQWWGPHGFATRGWEIDLQVGGAFRYEMYEIASDKGHWVSGIYTAIEPNRRLTTTASIEWGADSELEDVTGMTIDVQFIPEGDKTRIVGTQTGLPAASWVDGATEGWSQQFEKLGVLLARH